MYTYCGIIGYQTLWDVFLNVLIVLRSENCKRKNVQRFGYSNCMGVSFEYNYAVNFTIGKLLERFTTKAKVIVYCRLLKVLNASATVRASMFIVWVNFYLSCEVSYEMVHKNKDILKGVPSSSMYVKNKEGAVTGASNLLKLTL